MNLRKFVLPAFLLALASPALADEPKEAQAPIVPVTRDEMKQVLEGSKRSTPRLPLPPPTEEEIAAAKKAGAAAPGLGGIINNGRMRKIYLPSELTGTGGGFFRGNDPAMTLDPAFKTMFFWIVSRANNCYYCMGHQEVKLASSGITEDKIAALDGDWSEFTPAEQAAFAFTKKLTFEPNKLADADIDALRRHYNDNQILEIILSVAGFNAMNRWTGALAIPQEDHREYLTPTPAKYRDNVSRVAPLDPSRFTAKAKAAPTHAVSSRRPKLESRAEVEAALDVARKRTPRLPVPDESKARAALSSDSPSGALPQWVRLLTTFPKAGVARADSFRAGEENGALPPLMRAQIAWIAARNDRAWYALGQAKARLSALGASEDDIYALDGPLDRYPAADRAAFAFVRKLTVDPALITDADVAGLRKLYTDKQVAELIYRVTEAAYFDRLTESAGLRLEEAATKTARVEKAGN